jgi:2-hydroxychromene-2-carboxylate isomerase
MAQAIDFYFDFSSPYGYLAAEKINALAAKHGRAVNWRPILLGAVFKVNGQKPLTLIPMKDSYAVRDIARSARFMGLPLTMPSKFPINGVAPTRAFYWLNEKDAALAQALALACLRAFFVEDQDISKPETVAAVAKTLGIAEGEILDAMNSDAVKDTTRKAVDAAITAGVFGSPYVVVDNEPFWGADRLDQVARWLEKGPW